MQGDADSKGNPTYRASAQVQAASRERPRSIARPAVAASGLGAETITTKGV